MDNEIQKITYTGHLRRDIAKALHPLGGIETFINPGEAVLLKPNFNTADTYPASSSLDFLEAVVEIVKTTNPSRILLGDSCTISQKTSSVMEKLGIFELGKRLGIEIVNFDKEKFVTKKIPGTYLKSVCFPKILFEVDKIILLPCIKTHRYARFTVSLKLAVGLLKKLDRLRMHASHLEEKIAELNLAYQPDLIIADGRKSFVTNGPESGDMVEPNTLLAGTDRVALDIEAVRLLQSFHAKNLLVGDVLEQPMIKHARELGIK